MQWKHTPSDRCPRAGTVSDYIGEQGEPRVQTLEGGLFFLSFRRRSTLNVMVSQRYITVKHLRSSNNNPTPFGAVVAYFLPSGGLGPGVVIKYKENRESPGFKPRKGGSLFCLFAPFTSFHAKECVSPWWVRVT